MHRKNGQLYLNGTGDIIGSAVGSLIGGAGNVWSSSITAKGNKDVAALSAQAEAERTKQLQLQAAAQLKSQQDAEAAKSANMVKIIKTIGIVVGSLLLVTTVVILIVRKRKK